MIKDHLSWKGLTISKVDDQSRQEHLVYSKFFLNVVGQSRGKVVLLKFPTRSSGEFGNIGEVHIRKQAFKISEIYGDSYQT